MQKTVGKELHFQGTGLHTGRACRTTVRPAEADSGIQFVKRNGTVSKPIRVSHENVSNTEYATTLGTNGVRFSTIEHLVSALHGSGVDNALVEVEGGEVPILDGSARPFVQALLSVGCAEQEAPGRVLRVLCPVHVEAEGKSARLEPYENFSVAYRIDFESALVRNQSWEMEISPESYAREISGARTFCMRREVDLLWSRGLARGGSLANSVVFENGHVLNPEGLRFKDEPVRHKILDAVGDLALAGCRIRGRFVGDRAGHTLNLLLLRKLFSTPGAFDIVEA